MILEDMQSNDKTVIMELLSKYGIVSFFDKKCFELSVTFATVLQSYMKKHHPLIATLFAVKSYAEGSTDIERAVMSTHILLNVISTKQKMEIMKDIIPLMAHDSNFEADFLSKLIAKIKSMN